MKLIVQRTTGAVLSIDKIEYSRSGFGLVVLYGTKTGDRPDSCGILADKLVNLRIFEDAKKKMNLSALEIGAEIMIVSQFTLYADTSKGRRPSYGDAMEPVEAENQYDIFVERVKASGLKVVTGSFGASMDINFTNHGPVTIILEHDAD